MDEVRGQSVLRSKRTRTIKANAAVSIRIILTASSDIAEMSD